MLTANYKINFTTISSASTATTVNIPINMEYQMVDNSDLIERVFVDTEIEKAINPIIDFEKVRFLPVTSGGNLINKIIYKITINGQNTYNGDAFGFEYNDLRFKKESFKQTNLSLVFYDNPNQATQALATNVKIYSNLTNSDYYPSNSLQPGKLKPLEQIDVTFDLENPLTSPTGFFQGYHLYYYKSDFKIGDEKYLYMRGTYFNAKTGVRTTLMSKDTTLPVNQMIKEVYTRYKLFRTNTGYYYTIDDTYQGVNQTLPTNNVTYDNVNNQVIVNLYNVKVI